MKRYFIITALLFQGVLAVKEQTVPDSLDHFLIARMKKNHIPGLQLAVIRNGKIVKSAGYGLANLQDSVPVTSQTIFQLNSITKAPVGVAVMQLVEAGKLDLSRSVSFYLDSLPESWRQVNVRQLLTHNSGLPKILDNNTGKLIGETDGAAWANVKAMPMEFKPGERFSYNQTNYVLVGKIINKLTGEDFTRFIKEKQLDVVNMPNTSFFDSHDVVKHAARVYSYSTFINNVRYRTSEPQNVFYEFSPFIRATVGLNTKADEMAHWVIALQQGQLLKDKSSLPALWRPGLLNNGQTAGFSRMFNGYAIGWSAIIRPEHRAMAPIGAGASAVFVYPDDNLSVIILTNLQGANPEEFADEVAGFYIPDMRASSGFGLPPAIRSFRAILVKKGFDQAIPVVKIFKRKPQITG
jgi:CubicO group peptidase (beta-lactamase class C family)